MGTQHGVIERLYDIVDEMAMLLVEHASLSYLEALCAASAHIKCAAIPQEVSEEVRGTLFGLAKQFVETEFEAEEVRKALQLALLKGMKSRHMSSSEMTPDSVALIIGHLIGKLMHSLNGRSLADFACGTGNLLTTVLNMTGATPTEIYGVDVDREMLELSKMMADMQGYEVQFVNQSSAGKMSIPDVDVVISDLPTKGQIEASDADSALIASGCHYLPYLLVENQLNYLVDGGYAVYVIGNDFFLQEDVAKFHEALTSTATVGMLLQLPASLFKDLSKQKSILVIKKNGEGDALARETLVASFPDFKNIEAFRATLTKIEKWITMGDGSMG